MIDRTIKTIVFDIDDTIADLKNPMCQALNKYTGKTIHWNDWNKFNITDQDLYNISYSELCDVLINGNILQNIIPLKETREVLTEIKSRGYNLVYITARGYHPNAYNVTKQWFADWNLPCDSLYICEKGKTKPEYVKDYKDIRMFIDDRFDNCKDFRSEKSKTTVVLKNEPWNVYSHGQDGYDYKIDNLNEVITLLES